MRLDEIVGSLQTYELTLLNRRKKKAIAFKTMKEDESDLSDNDGIEGNLALLSNNFNKFW
jgi:hypothetical protein